MHCGTKSLAPQKFVQAWWRHHLCGCTDHWLQPPFHGVPVCLYVVRTHSRNGIFWNWSCNSPFDACTNCDSICPFVGPDDCARHNKPLHNRDHCCRLLILNELDVPFFCLGVLDTKHPTMMTSVILPFHHHRFVYLDHLPRTSQCDWCGKHLPGHMSRKCWHNCTPYSTTHWWTQPHALCWSRVPRST